MGSGIAPRSEVERPESASDITKAVAEATTTNPGSTPHQGKQLDDADAEHLADLLGKSLIGQLDDDPPNITQFAPHPPQIVPISGRARRIIKQVRPARDLGQARFIVREYLGFGRLVNLPPPLQPPPMSGVLVPLAVLLTQM